jgi:hypothetical protein
VLLEIFEHMNVDVEHRSRFSESRQHSSRGGPTPGWREIQTRPKESAEMFGQLTTLETSEARAVSFLRLSRRFRVMIACCNAGRDRSEIELDTLSKG